MGLGLDLEPAVAQRLGRSIGSAVLENKAKVVSLVLPTRGTQPRGLQHILLGLYEGLYADSRYKLLAENTADKISLYSLVLHNIQGPWGRKERLLAETNARARSIAAGHYLARDLVNAPPNSKTPVIIAQQAQQMAEELEMECKVLGEASAWCNMYSAWSCSMINGLQCAGRCRYSFCTYCVASICRLSALRWAWVPT
ncbi:hypothetical protein EON64_09180 [archaeon]|nr:MAG: hypothetical protein EON64_09180 [archaeon]